MPNLTDQQARLHGFLRENGMLWLIIMLHLKPRKRQTKPPEGGKLEFPRLKTKYHSTLVLVHHSHTNPSTGVNRAGWYPRWWWEMMRWGINRTRYSSEASTLHFGGDFENEKLAVRKLFIFYSAKNFRCCWEILDKRFRAHKKFAAKNCQLLQLAFALNSPCWALHGISIHLCR